jgi:hypothetical protein
VKKANSSINSFFISTSYEIFFTKTMLRPSILAYEKTIY